MIKTKKCFFLWLIMLLFVSCLGKENESEGTDVVEVSEEPEGEAIQAPEHPEGLEFVDVVLGEWDKPNEEILKIGTDYLKLYEEGYVIFKEDFTIDIKEYAGHFEQSWSYDPDQYIFEYEGNMDHRYRVISYNEDELVLLELVDHLPEIQQKYFVEEGLTSTPQHWVRWESGK